MLALCALTLAAALVLGGGTRPGLPSDAVLQLLSIPLLLAAIAAHVGALRRHKSDGRASLFSVLFCGFASQTLKAADGPSRPAGLAPR